jgi:WD40 repeat protein
VAKIGRDVARALAFAHAASVLHRDIKPSNLLLDRDGEVHLADFGLARTLDNDGSMTVTGEFLGTLRYAAPETLHGSYDHRCDVYSLGVTLFELAIRGPAFVAPTRESLLEKILHGTVGPWPRTSPIKRDLRTIIQKAMATDAKARYQNATAMAEDLERFLDGRPILARPATPLDYLVGWCRRHPLPVSLAGILVVTLAAGLISSLWLWHEVDETQRRMAFAQRRADVSESLVKSQQDVAERSARDVASKVAQLEHVKTIRSLQSRQDGEAQLRAVHALRFAEQLGQENTRIADSTAAATPAATADSPAAALFAMPLTVSSRLIASSLASQLPRPLNRYDMAERIRAWQLLELAADVGRASPSLRFSTADDTLLVGTRQGGDFHAWNIRRETFQPLLDKPSLTGIPVYYCHETGQAMIQRPDRQLELWDVALGRLLRPLEVDQRYRDSLRLHAVWMSPNGKRLLLHVFNSLTGPTCWLYDPASGRPVSEQRPATHSSFQAQFSPDSRFVYIDGARGQLWDTDLFTLIGDHFPAQSKPVFTAQELVLGGPDELLCVPLAKSAGPTQSRRIRLPQNAQLSTLHADSEKGRVIVGTRDGEILAYRLADEQLEERVRHGVSPVSHLIPSPDGRHVLAADLSGRVALWDANLRAMEAAVLEHRDEVADLAWSRDSKRFATVTASGRLAVWQRAEAARIVGQDVAFTELAPDGTSLLLVYQDGRLEIANLANGQVVKRSTAPTARVAKAVWGPLSDRIALLVGEDSTRVFLWNLADDRQGAFEVQPALPVRPNGQVFFAKGGSRLLVNSWPSLLGYEFEGLLPGSPGYGRRGMPSLMLDLIPGPNRQQLHLLASETLVFGCLSPALAHHEKKLYCWDATSGKIVFSDDLPLGLSTNQLALASDRRTLLAVGDYGLLAWDTKVGERLPLASDSHNLELLQVVVHPAHTFAATLGRDQIIRCFDYRTGTRVGEPIHCSGGILTIAWTADGRVIQSMTAGTGLQLWDWFRGEPLSQPISAGNTVASAQYSRVANRWVVRSDDESHAVTLLAPPMPEGRSVSEWTARAHYLTGLQLDAAGDRIRPLDVAAWRALRDRFQPEKSAAR